MTDRHNTGAAPNRGEQCEVLIAGGGVAGLEAAFALRELAGKRVTVSILTPNTEFVYRPMSVAEPFSSGSAGRYPLAALAGAAGAALLQDALVQVDVTGQQVLTANGAELSYDALLICLGASVHTHYDHAVTVDDAHMDDLLHGLVQDIEGGYVHRLAIVVPTQLPWPLPAYELALMASERAWDMQTDLSVTVVTPEKAPLEVFGEEVSLEMGRLLADRKVEVITSATCEVPNGKTIRVRPDDRSLEFDSIIALPNLRGPAITGLPSDNGGFLPVDAYAKVTGAQRVWAAGDATDFAIRHGGVSAQMADIAALSIAAFAGAPVETRRFEPVLEGVLLTGGRPRHLGGRAADDQGVQSELRASERAEGAPKIAARYLAAHLAAMTPTSYGQAGPAADAPSLRA